MLRDLCRAGLDCTMEMSGSESRRQSYKDIIASILALVISIGIIAFIGKYLWNATVAELFTVVRPVRSAWQIIGFMILLSLFR